MPGAFSPHDRLQRKPLVSDPGMPHGTCFTHVPWCMAEWIHLIDCVDIITYACSNQKKYCKAQYNTRHNKTYCIIYAGQMAVDYSNISYPCICFVKLHKQYKSYTISLHKNYMFYIYFLHGLGFMYVLSMIAVLRPSVTRHPLWLLRLRRKLLRSSSRVRLTILNSVRAWARLFHVNASRGLRPIAAEPQSAQGGTME